MGENCDKCHPYPDCKHGTCNKPWECNCEPGWGGLLCDEKLDYCEKNPKTCLNDGKCTSLLKEDGDFKCECPSGYKGKNCEIAPVMRVPSTTSTASTTAKTTTTTTTEATAQDALEVGDEMAMQEPENAPKTRGDTIPEDEEDEEDSFELEDIDNEAF